MTSATKEFTLSLPIAERFVDALPQDHYRPLPDDWLVAVTDVVQSRKAIAAGRYKAVNMAGVSMISAIMNGLGHQNIPYIFGGDGAALAFAANDHDVAKEALAAVGAWAKDELHLELRAAIVPVKDIRSAGADVQVAAVSVSDVICNYAFVGGGVGLAEKLMKEGKHRIEPAPSGTRPNLDGLSCRWAPIGESDRKIVSLILEPQEGETEIAPDVVAKIMALVNADGVDASPVHERGHKVSWGLESMRLETTTTGNSLMGVIAFRAFAWLLDVTSMKFAGFVPKVYREYVKLNTDYRKIQDGIRMTLAMSGAELQRLEAALTDYKNKGALRFGLCEQDRALLTCFVQSALADNHFHFLDGAGGGYAAAADDLARRGGEMCSIVLQSVTCDIRQC